MKIAKKNGYKDYTSNVNIDIMQFEDIAIHIRPSDGYINATYLCALGRRQVHDYVRLQSTKTFLQLLSTQLGIGIEFLTESTKGGKAKTWVHPQVATHLASWISPAFHVHVTQWIERAKSLDAGIKVEYEEELAKLEPETRFLQERHIRDNLASKLDAAVEVPCRHGVVDIVSTDAIIEIKHASKYLHALGQVLGYSESFPDKTARVHLFGSAHELTTEFIRKVESLYDNHRVVLTYELVGDD